MTFGSTFAYIENQRDDPLRRPSMTSKAEDKVEIVVQVESKDTGSKSS